MSSQKIFFNFVLIILLLISFLVTNYDLNLGAGFKALKMPFNYDKHFIAAYSKKRTIRDKGLYTLHEWRAEDGKLTQVDYLNRLTKWKMKTVYNWLDGYKNISYFRFFKLVKTERFYPNGKPEKIQDYIKLEQSVYFDDGSLAMESKLKWVKGRPVLEQYLPDVYMNYYYPGVQGDPVLKEAKIFGTDGTAQSVIYHLNGNKMEIGYEKIPPDFNGRFLRTGKWQFFDQEGRLWKELTYDGEMILDEKLYEKGRLISSRVLKHRQ